MYRLRLDCGRIEIHFLQWFICRPSTAKILVFLFRLRRSWRRLFVHSLLSRSTYVDICMQLVNFKFRKVKINLIKIETNFAKTEKSCKSLSITSKRHSLLSSKSIAPIAWIFVPQIAKRSTPWSENCKTSSDKNYQRKKRMSNHRFI